VTEGPAKTPVEQAVAQAVDLFVYAPIGLLFDGATLLPQLVERGRSQVTMARLIGRFAVGQGRTEATKAASRLQDQAAGVLGFIGDSVAAPMPGRPSTSPVNRPASRAATRPSPTEGRPTPKASAADLAIPDYDGLSASQVVNRLAGLSSTELASVQRYEAANRGRKTILSKVAQLQGS
jgi:hypothetical protein